MPAKIDLVGSGPEDTALASGLRGAGMIVDVRGLDEVPRTRADLVVLAGDLAGALEAIRRLRDDGAAPDTPVVLLGTPEGAEGRATGRAFGAEAVLARPIALDALIDTIEQVLAPPASSVSASRVGSRQETTLQLDPGRENVISRAEHREPTLHLVGDDALTPDMITPDSGAEPLREVRATPLSRTPSEIRVGSTERAIERSSSGGSRASASISDHLRDLLAAADRRAFPGRPPIDLWLPGGDEPALELVPNELLEHADPSLDAAPDEDPIDAFTFVGGPVLPRAAIASEPPPAAPSDEPPHKKTSPGTPTSLSRRPPARTTRPPSERPAPPNERALEPWEPASPSTGVHEAQVRALPHALRAPSEWPSEDSVLGRATSDGGRRGTFAEGGALRLLMRIVELELDARVSITPSQGDTVTLVTVGGEIAALEGPEACRAVEIARGRERSIAPAVHGEAAARRALEDAVVRGALTPFERDRALREAREALIREIVAAPRGSFSLSRQDVRVRGASLLAAPLASTLIEAARRAIGPAQARAILGGPVELRRGPRFEELVSAAMIAPELAALFARHEGETDTRILEEAADEPGLPGLIAALVAARALIASPSAIPEPAPLERARIARKTIEEAARLAEEGDYFAILGVAIDASERDLFHAYQRRVEVLTSLPLDPLDLAALEPARKLALEALEEAHRALAIARLREAYAAALGARSAPGVGLAGRAPSH